MNMGGKGQPATTTQT